jgi:hypothetical protein
MPLPVFSTFSNCLDQTRSRVWLVASELEDHSSKCSISYRRQLKRDLLGTRGCWGLVGVREWDGIYYCGVLAACSTSRLVILWQWQTWSLLVLFPYLVSMSPGQMVLSRPSRKRGCLFLCLSVLAFVFGMHPISRIGRAIDPLISASSVILGAKPLRTSLLFFFQ